MKDAPLRGFVEASPSGGCSVQKSTAADPQRRDDWLAHSTSVTTDSHPVTGTP